MSKKLRNGLVNASALTVQGPDNAIVDGDVDMKKDRESGSQKKTEDGTPQWIVPVIVPNGRERRGMRITVNSKRAPAVSDGDLVIFTGLIVGGFVDGRNSVLYFSASGVEVVGHEDDDTAQDQLNDVLDGVA